MGGSRSGWFSEPASLPGLIFLGPVSSRGGRRHRGLQATQRAEDRIKLTEDMVKEREMIISSLEAELTSYKNEVTSESRVTIPSTD